MAHHGQEVALGAVGGVGLLCRLAEGLVALPEVRLGLNAAGDVLLDPQEVGDPARGIEDGGDGSVFPIVFAVLPLVAQFSIPGLAGQDRLPQVPVSIWAGFAGLQETRIPSQDLTPGVAGKLGKPGVHVFNFPGGIGDHGGGGALLHRAGQLVELVLLAMLLRGVAEDEHSPEKLAARVVDGGAAIGDVALAAVAGNEQGGIGRSGDPGPRWRSSR